MRKILKSIVCLILSTITCLSCIGFSTQAEVKPVLATSVKESAESNDVVQSYIDWNTLNTKLKTVKLIEVHKKGTSYSLTIKSLNVSVTVSMDKDVYVVGEKWGSTVNLTFYHPDYAGKVVKTFKPNVADGFSTPTGFSTSKITMKMDCSVTYDGNTYKLPNIMCVSSRRIFCTRSASSEPYHEYVLANSSKPTVTSRILVGKNGISLKYQNFLNSRKITYSDKLKKDFTIKTPTYDATSGYTTITFVPKSAFLKAGNVNNYYVTITGKDGSKACSLKMIFNATPSVSLTAQVRGFTVSWTKTAIISGYQVKYSKNKNMSSSKTVTVNGKTANKTSVSNLPVNTNYYVQVRSFHKAGKSTFYSEWSSVNSVKTKNGKMANTLAVKGKTATVKSTELKKNYVILSRASVMTISGAKGKLSFSKSSGNKKIGISISTGMIMVKKGLQKGTYKIGIKATAAGNSEYNAATVPATITIVVK